MNPSLVRRRETSKTSGASSSTITYSEEEVEEMEGVIGEITKELAELKAVHKHDEVEYERNRSAVANFRSKYRELTDLRQQRSKLEAEVQQVKAQLEMERADHGPGSPRMPGAFKVPLFNIKRDKSKPGAPYDQYFENVIAPAMLDSGATPKQINTIISEFFFP